MCQVGLQVAEEYPLFGGGFKPGVRKASPAPGPADCAVNRVGASPKT
jgi:hypothetical protein